jgi:hypothetical protein
MMDKRAQPEEKSAAEKSALLQDLNRVYGLKLAEGLSAGEMEALLAGKLNTMIRTDFSALVQLLYRIDINETRLRQLLQTNTGEDAGKIIARLIIERLWQKIQTRRLYTPPNANGEQEWKDV